MAKKKKIDRNALYQSKDFDPKAALAEKYGKGVIDSMENILGDDDDLVIIPSSSARLNLAMGTGGFVKRGIYEVAGSSGSGKTSTCLDLIAQAQLLGLHCVYVDAEGGVDLEWARKIGVDTGELEMAWPDNGEQALEIVDMYARSGTADVIVVDSVAALTPSKELNEEDLADKHMALQASMMSKHMRKITMGVMQNEVCLTFVNQYRDGIGGPQGSYKKTTGGNALTYYCHARIGMGPVQNGVIKTGEVATGTTVRAKVTKNRFAPPMTECQLYIDFLAGGIDRPRELLLDGIDNKLVYTSGRSFIYLPPGVEDKEDGTVLATDGLSSAVAGLREDDDTMDEIDDRLQVLAEEKKAAKAAAAADKRAKAKAKAKEAQAKRAEKRAKLAAKAAPKDEDFLIVGGGAAPRKKTTKKKTTKKKAAKKKAAKKATKTEVAG